MAIHLHLVCGCFQDTATELNYCDRDYTACKAKNIHYLALFRQSVLTTDLDKEPSKCAMRTLLVRQDALYKNVKYIWKISKPYLPS